jgi:uncharacterized protein
MTGEADRCREHEAFRRIDAAFRAGDFEGLRDALGSPDGFPDVNGPITIGHCLEYAIYHSPLPFIRLLLERGADPNYADHVAVTTSAHSRASWPRAPTSTRATRTARPG